MPVDLAKEDEVWLALVLVGDFFKSEHHKANENSRGCSGCRVYGFVERGKAAYIERLSKE